MAMRCGGRLVTNGAVLQLNRSLEGGTLNGLCIHCTQLTRPTESEGSSLRVLVSLYSRGTVVMEKRVALVTGASQGIGCSIAKKLSSLGCTVILHGRNRERLEELEKDLQEKYRHPVSHICADLTNREEIEHMFSSIKEKYPDGVDIVINNAGMSLTKKTTDTTTEDWDQMLGLMLTAPFLIIRNYLPDMTRKGWGRIINISSVLGLRAGRSTAAYVSAKHGLQGLTKMIALENAEAGVTCNAVCPGYTDTPMIELFCERRARMDGCTPEQFKERHLSSCVPMNELVEVDNIAELVAFLCSEAARQMTGVSLPVDGGWTAQ